MADNNLSKAEKLGVAFILALILLVVVIIVAVVGTTLYLALHNWG